MALVNKIKPLEVFELYWRTKVLRKEPLEGFQYYRASSFASFALYRHHNLFEESATIGRFCKKNCAV